MNNQLLMAIDPNSLKSEERILLAAMKIFADYPPELASIRMIAREADVAFSAITYYFKTKDNLYQEVIRRVAGAVAQTYSLPETPLTDPEAAKIELRAFFGQAIDMLCGNPYAVYVAKIVLREHLAPSPVYDQLNESMFKKILGRMVDVVLCITGDGITGDGVTGEMDRRQATLQFFSMVGQVIGFRIQRELMVRHLGFTGFSTIEIEELKTLVFRNIFRQLGCT